MRPFTTSLRRIAIALAFGAVAASLAAPSAGALPKEPAFDPGPQLASASTCATPVGTPGSIQALQFTKRNWPLTGGLHMNTSGRIDRNSGIVDATVHLYNSYWGMGYTGSVLMVLRDKCGGTIGVTTPGKWGVDAKSWFWNTNERHVYYSAQVSPVIANRVASVEVIHNRDTGNESISLYRSLRDAACRYLMKEIPIITTCPIPNLR